VPAFAKGIGAVEKSLAETLRPSAEELRDEAWQLLNQRNSASNRQVRRQLAERAFELALVAQRLETEASERLERRPTPEK
jgi:SOS response regulatory protein OraA/RecX